VNHRAQIASADFIVVAVFLYTARSCLLQNYTGVGLSQVSSNTFISGTKPKCFRNRKHIPNCIFTMDANHNYKVLNSTVNRTSMIRNLAWRAFSLIL